MDEESRQERWLILLAAVICAFVIGYNAFYVPDATVAWARESSAPASSAPPSDGEYTPAEVSSSSVPQAVSASEARSAAPEQGGKIDINSATAAQLSDGLPGIGETLAKRIVAYREQNGPFRSIEEIRNVDGIGEKKYEAIRKLITAG